ncbi:general stress protein CsbD [Gimesia maris]|uniref:general stress protein CsbD n=1 Tax=Gimesia maris TaxID=122 RepID=UPI0030D9551C|tara:strand:- start:81496 stop:81945 length:450 start_codon:yes stop_codon:yes gene_type:complete
MTTREELRGHWNEIRGRIEERWSQLNSSDLDGLEGKTDQLVGRIQQKTGETKRDIQRELDSMVESFSQSASTVADKMGDTLNEAVKNSKEQFAHASDAAREQYEQVNQSVQKGYREAERTVRKHPAESVAVAFGTGLIAGVIVSLAWRR